MSGHGKAFESGPAGLLKLLPRVPLVLAISESFLPALPLPWRAEPGHEGRLTRPPPSGRHACCPATSSWLAG
jgi:hypothetical protein